MKTNRIYNVAALGRQSTSLILFLMIIGCAVISMAASSDVPDFGVVPLSAPDGMVLIIGGPLLHRSAASPDAGGWIGYHVYRRKAGDSAFTRLTNSPLSRPGSLAELEQAMGGPIDGFERFAGLANKQELWQSIVKGDTSIIAISFLSKNFRKALGMLLVDTQVEPNTLYEYMATLVALDGSESAPSEIQRATFGTPLLPLLGPLSVTGESTDKGVALGWTANPADSGAFSYSVYRCPDSVGSFLRLNLAALTLDVDSTGVSTTGSFIDTTARPGRTYYYAVVSSDYAGNESPRARLVPVNLVDVSRPSVPQNVFAHPTDLGLTLTWDTVTGVVGYNVYRSTDADSNYTRLNEVVLPADTGLYEDKSATLVDRYFYRVTAVNRSGYESEQSARALSLYGNRLPPVPPQDVQADAQVDGILVRWRAGDEPDVQGYYVFRADGFNSVLSQVSPLIGRDTTSFLDTSRYLSGGGQYWYLVQSINYTGLASALSLPAAAHFDRPDSVEAPRSFFGYADGSFVRLFWTSTGDNATHGYHVYRAKEADSLIWDRLTTTPLARTAGEFTDTAGQVGSVYLYQVRPINDNAEESSPSHNLRVVLYEAAPMAPGGVRVTQDGNELMVTWSKSLHPSVTGYRIYRRSDMEDAILLTAQPLANVMTSYRDSSAKTGVRYYYSICCLDQSGREGNRSAEVAYLHE